MKSASLAVMALLGYASAVQIRDSIEDPAFYAGLYTNILLDVDSFKKEHAKPHHRNHPVRSRDEYDGDSNTVSPYDAMDKNDPWTNKQRADWFEERGKHQNQKIYDLQMDSQNLAQRKHHRSHTQGDAYDFDPTTASTYDQGNNINGGNPVGIHNSYTDNDVPIGPPEKDLIAAIKKGYWWNKELEKEMKRPTDYPDGQTAARGSYAGAIPKVNGQDYCEGVGAKCDADKVLADEEKEKKAEAAEENNEAKKEAEKIVKDEKAKAEKKEKGEGPKEEAPEAPAAEAAAPAEKAALAQHHHRHHKHHHRH